MITLSPAVQETDALADQLAELSAHLDAATHRFLVLLRRFDDLGGWAVQGATSCAKWLSWRVGLTAGAAREQLRVTHALADLPHIDAAFAAGRLSYSKVRAVTRVATAENELALLDLALSSTAAQLERICRGYRRVLTHEGAGSPADEAAHRWLRVRDTADGYLRFELQVRPEEAAVVRQAIAVARERAWKGADVSAETPTALVDGLLAVAEDYLRGGAEGGPPVEVVLHLEADGTGTLDDGTVLASATTERLRCDAAVVAAVDEPADGLLESRRRRRTVTTLQRRALRLRDQGCRFPGCTSQRVDGHHVVPWSMGGSTTMANLCSLCRRHHTYVHEYGFRVQSTTGGGFRFLRPDGVEVIEVLPAPRLERDPVDDLRAAHRAAGLAIDVETNRSSWDGRAADISGIVAGLVA
jgi:Domain of unknown function (DUF222)/HNH endonuclease